MSLSDEAKGLLEATRGLHDPTPYDEARVLDGLVTRLGAPPQPPSPSPPRWRPRVLAGGLKVVLPVLVIVALTQRGPSRPTAAPPVGEAAPIAKASTPPPDLRPLPTLTRPREVDPAGAPPVASPPTRPTPRRSAPRTSAPGLAEELNLLEQARDALAAGRAEDALRTIEGYQRRFQRGLLFEESASLRIRALCASGRGAEAERLREEFTKRWSHSSQAPLACASR